MFFFSAEKSSRLERFVPKRGNLSKALSVDASDARHKIFKLKKNKSVDDRQELDYTVSSGVINYIFAIFTNWPLNTLLSNYKLDTYIRRLNGWPRLLSSVSLFIQCFSSAYIIPLIPPFSRSRAVSLSVVSESSESTGWWKRKKILAANLIFILFPFSRRSEQCAGSGESGQRSPGPRSCCEGVITLITRENLAKNIKNIRCPPKYQVMKKKQKDAGPWLGESRELWLASQCWWLCFALCYRTWNVLFKREQE